MNKEILISQYIDDELSLDEKITFVRTVHVDSDFTEETLELLEFEKQIQQLPAHHLPPAPVVVHSSPQRDRLFGLAWWKPFAAFAAAGAAALFFFISPQPKPMITQESHRFVVYLPNVEQAQIMGTFTDWQPKAMTPIGESGYWTLTLKLPVGEHRYSYLVGQDRQIPDPTVALREQDDFGGENSVLEIGRAAI